MKAIPLVRASVVLPFVKFLDHIGAPTERLLVRANLPICAFQNPEALIPFNQSFAFIEQAARSEGLENFGLLVAQQTQFLDLGAFGSLVAQSLTLHDFLQKLLRLHQTLLNGEQIWLTEEGDSLWLHHQYTIPHHIRAYQVQYYTILMYLNALRFAIGPNWHPDEVHLSGPHEFKSLFDLDFLANTPIHFHQPTNAIRFSKMILSQPLNSLAQSTFPCVTEETLKQTSPSADFPSSLSQLIRSLLPEGYPNLAIAADAAGMSVRTFQRRLEENNLSYSDLIDRVRLERAIELLQDRSIKLIDVAFELGYTEPANFSKAFKRWTGVSPREFRNLHLQVG